MKGLRVSDALALPLDTVTSTLIVYGGKGMGKTVYGAVLAEELAAARLRWSWLDPLGVAWGIRHSADGKGPGVECLILGGTHGDIPIEPSGGAAVADVVVEESCNVLVDFSRKPSGEMWGIGEKIRFVTDYGRRLFQRQGDLIQGRRREPLMQFLDEGARYIPQNIPAGNEALSFCVSAWQQLVEEGRNVGLGVCILTQRSARVNKDVAELADAMVAFRTVGPRSLAAVLDWLGEHVDRERIKDLSQQVRKLERGSALIVSPGWLQLERVVPIRMRRTFDSSATPKAGERARTAKGEGAKPDLAKIRERMLETIERAKADDPKELRKRIVDLEKQVAVAAKVKAAPPAPPKIERVEIPKVEVQKVEVPVFKAEHVVAVKRVEGLLGKAVEAFTKITAALEASERRGQTAVQKIATLQGEAAAAAKKLHADKERRAVSTTVRPPAAPAKERPEPTGALSRAPQRILNALAFLESIGIAQASRTQLGFLSNQRPTSGGFANHLGKLRSAGFIDYPTEGHVHLTDDGRECAIAEDVPATSEELHAAIRKKLQPAKWRIVEALIAAYPEDMAREALAKEANQSSGSGGYANHLGALRSLGLIDYPQSGRVVAKPVLFLEGR